MNKRIGNQNEANVNAIEGNKKKKRFTLNTHE